LTIPGSARPHLPELRGLDELLDIFSLCNILILSNVLDDRTYCPSGTAIPLTERYTIAYARGLCLWLLDALDRLYVLATVGSEANFTDNLTSVGSIAAKFLAQQSAAILDYKQTAEKNGMRGALHCTSSKLRRQLEGCLTIWPECAEHFQICRKASEQSMEWVSDQHYQLLPRPVECIEGNIYIIRLIWDTKTLKVTHHDILARGSTPEDYIHFKRENDGNFFLCIVGLG
jgi:hypothetical protein